MKEIIMLSANEPRLWRREWDSNPRYLWQYTSFPSLRRELCGILNHSFITESCHNRSPPSTWFVTNLSQRFRLNDGLKKSLKCSSDCCRTRRHINRGTESIFNFASLCFIKRYLLGLRYLIWLYNTKWWIVNLNKYLLAKNNIKNFLNIFFHH